MLNVPIYYSEPLTNIRLMPNSWWSRLLWRLIEIGSWDLELTFISGRVRHFRLLKERDEN